MPGATRPTLACGSYVLTFCLGATLGSQLGVAGTLVSDAFFRRITTEPHDDYDRRMSWFDAFDQRYDQRV